MREKASKTLDMTQGPIGKTVIAFAIPLLIGNLFQQLYNVVDSIVVGNFIDYTALSAVGTAGTPLQIFVALFLGIGTGATILISQFMGGQDLEGVKKTVKTATTFLTVSSVPLTILGIALTPSLLHMMNVPEQVYPMARDYLMIVFLGTICSLGYNVNVGILRGMGDSRSPLYFLIASTLVNIVLDLIFVALLNWGVPGVAVATVIAQTTAWVFSILYIKKKYPQLELKVFRLTIDKSLLKHMVRLGLPLGFNNAVFALGFLLLQSLINMQGDIFMAGATAASRVDNLVFLPIQSFGAAATTFAGQNVGARCHDRLRTGFKTILLITLAINICMATVLLGFGKYALMMFSQKQEVIAVGLQCMRWIVPFYSIFCIYSICNNFMNGAGEVRMPTLSSLVMFWVVRLPVAYLMFDLFGRDYIYSAYPISWTAGAIISGIYFLTGRWKRHYLKRAGMDVECTDA